MTYESDTGAIEAGLEKKRSALANDLDELSSRASIDYIANEALGVLKANSAGYTRSLESAIKANPVAFALVGVGVAWMMFGGKSADPYNSYGAVGTIDDPNPEWHRKMVPLREKARATLGKLEAEASRSVDTMKSKIGDQVEQVRDFAAERAQVIEDFAVDLKTGISEGLDHLSEQARAQVMAAREQSYAALLRAERVIKGGTREAVAVVEEHPLATGAVALALGALAGIALMRSADDEDQAYSSSYTQPTRHSSAAGRGAGDGRGMGAAVSSGIGRTDPGQADYSTGMVNSGGSDQSYGNPSPNASGTYDDPEDKETLL